MGWVGEVGMDTLFSVGWQLAGGIVVLDPYQPLLVLACPLCTLANEISSPLLPIACPVVSPSCPWTKVMWQDGYAQIVGKPT